MNGNHASYSPQTDFNVNIPDPDPTIYDRSTLEPCQLYSSNPCIDDAIWGSTIAPGPLNPTSEYGENQLFSYSTSTDESNPIPIHAIIGIILGVVFLCWLNAFCRYLHNMETLRQEESESRRRNLTPATPHGSRHSEQQSNREQQTPNHQQRPNNQIVKESKALTPIEFEEMLLHTRYSDGTQFIPGLSLCPNVTHTNPETKVSLITSPLPEKLIRCDEAKEPKLRNKPEELTSMDDTNTSHNDSFHTGPGRCMNSNVDPESLLVTNEFCFERSSTSACSPSSDAPNTSKLKEEYSNKKEDDLRDCCSICIDEFNYDDLITVLPKCMHSFHTRCSRQWLLDSKATYCPLCKTDIK